MSASCQLVIVACSGLSHHRMLEQLHRHKAIIHEDAAKTQQAAQCAKWEWHHEMYAGPAAWEWHHEMHARPSAWKWHDDVYATPQPLLVNAQQTRAARPSLCSLLLPIVLDKFTSLFKTEKQRPAPDMREDKQKSKEKKRLRLSAST